MWPHVGIQHSMHVHVSAYAHVHIHPNSHTHTRNVSCHNPSGSHTHARVHSHNIVDAVIGVVERVLKLTTWSTRMIRNQWLSVDVTISQS